MHIFGLVALLLGGCALLYPTVQRDLPLPWISPGDAFGLAGLLVIMAGISLLFRRRT